MRLARAAGYEHFAGCLNDLSEAKEDIFAMHAILVRISSSMISMRSQITVVLLDDSRRHGVLVLLRVLEDFGGIALCLDAGPRLLAVGTVRKGGEAMELGKLVQECELESTDDEDRQPQEHPMLEALQTCGSRVLLATSTLLDASPH